MREPNITKPLGRFDKLDSVSALIAGLLIVATLAYWPTMTALGRYWTEEPSVGGHGPLVVGLAAWLFFRARDRISVAAVLPLSWAGALVLLCSLASLIFFRAGIQSLQLFMLPALVWLAVLTAFGAGVARAVAVPIGFLYFAMPAWNLLSVPLQQLTLRVVGVVAPLIGLPATVSGSLVSFPNGATFIVLLACSGVSFLVQGLAVATLLGELEGASLTRRLRLLAGMAVVALSANWIRVFLLLWIGYYGGMNNVIVSREHLLFGDVVFVGVLLAFVWLSTRGALPSKDTLEFPANRPQQVLLPGCMAAVVAIVAIPLSALVLGSRQSATAEVMQATPPPGRAEWHGPIDASDATWRPVFVGAHTQWHVIYVNPRGHTVESVGIGYAAQTQGRELINEQNSLLGDGGLSSVAVGLVDSEGRQYRETVATDRQGHKSVVWSLYDIGGRGFVTPLYSQLWYGVRSLGTPPYSRLLAFRATCDPSCGDARATIASFLRGMASQLFVSTGLTCPDHQELG